MTSDILIYFVLRNANRVSSACRGTAREQGAIHSKKIKISISEMFALTFYHFFFGRDSPLSLFSPSLRSLPKCSRPSTRTRP